MKIFCGIEGGASVSKLVLMSETGQELATADGPATNHLLIGSDECFARIAAMITTGLQRARVTDTCVESMAMCLSGCEDESLNHEMALDFQRQYPTLSRHCVVSSDTFGSLLTVSPDGGVVLIAGTGSNCLLYNPDGSHARCGGWGHVLGDYGSAFSVANGAIRAVIEAEDGFGAEHVLDTSRVRRLVLKHFSTDRLSGILPTVYQRFDKSQFASLCRPLADLAREDDPLARDLFRTAGVHLAQHVNAVLPRAAPALLTASGGLSVVCVGSVFKSWPLLQSGFVSALDPHSSPPITLRRLTTTSAVGAAVLAARECGVTLPVDSSGSAEVLRVN